MPAPNLTITNLIGTGLNSFRILAAAAPGAPTSGTYQLGEEYVDSAGQHWFCIVGGTPGTWVAPGTVTSIGLSVPAGLLTVAGSPVINNGTIALSLVAAAQNAVWAGPTAGSGAPTYRALVAGDLPVHNNAWGTITGTPTTRAGYGITDAELTIAAGIAAQYWRGDKTWQTLNAAAVAGLAAVATSGSGADLIAGTIPDARIAATVARLNVAQSWSGVQSLPTTMLRVVDGTDATKQLALSVAGLTTATTVTWAVPNRSDTFAGLGAQTFTGLQTLSAGQLVQSASGVTVMQAATQDGVIVTGRAGGVGSFAVTVQPATLSASWTQTLQNAAGTIALLQVGQTFTGAQTVQAAGGLTVLQAATQDAVAITGRAGGVGSFVVSLKPGTLSASQSQTLQNATRTVALLEIAQTFLGAQTLQAAGGMTVLQAATQDGVALVGRAGGVGSFVSTITPATLTASRTATLQDASYLIAGINLAQTWSALQKIPDNMLSLTASGDVTKIVQFSLAGLTTASTRVLSILDATQTLAGSIGTLAAGRLTYTTAAGILTTDAGLLYSTDALTLGDGVSQASLIVRSPAATQAAIQFQQASFLRWQAAVSAAVAYEVSAYTAAGAPIDVPISIPNAAGSAVTLNRVATIIGVAPALYTYGRTDIGGGRIVSNEIYTGALNLAFSRQGSAMTPETQFNFRASAISNSIAVGQWTNNALGPGIIFGKSRAAVPTHAVVVTGDELGSIIANGSDGTVFRDAARIQFFSDTGTPSATSMPGRIEFYTAQDGSISPTRRMSIVGTGEMVLGSTLPTAGAGLLQLPVSTTIAGGILLFDVGLFRNAATSLTVNAATIANFTGRLSVQSATAATTTATGALIVTGGAGIAGDLWALSLNTSTGTLTVSSGTDVTAVLGNIKIGSAISAGNAFFSVFGMHTTSNYALSQLTAGSTKVNAPTGQTVSLRVNDVALLTAGTSLVATVPLTLPASTTGSSPLHLGSGVAPTAPTNGDQWVDATVAHTFAGGVDQAMGGTLFASTADATAANTVTETAIIGSGLGTLTLPANFLAVGKSIRVKVYGYLSDTVTPTINIKVKFGSTVLCMTGAVALAGTITSNGFLIDVTITCRTSGATGTVASMGFFSYDNVGGTGRSMGLVTVGTSLIDTTSVQAVSVTATWGTASASNTITGQVATVEAVN